jgi:hypothetical protein
MKTLTMLFTLLLAISAGAQSKYTTFGLGGTAGHPFYSFDTINDSGQVLGQRISNSEAFVISPEGLWTKNIIKTNSSTVTMNNAATIVGEEAHNNRPFYKLWGQPAMQVAGCGNRTAVTAINTAGYVAGNCPIDIHRGQSGAFWANPPAGSLTVIPFPHDKYPNEWFSVQTMSLNDLNQIVGFWENYSTPYSGFFYDSKSKKLNTTFNMPRAVYTYPVSINDNQEVVGDWLDTNNVYHGFYWNPTAGFSDIDVAGDTAMYIVGINNQSVILGFWVDDNTPMLHHVVTIVNGKPTASINVPQSIAGSTTGIAINNVGQVVGEYETQAGIVRGFIYTPSK